jgi:hypothetical protein
MRKSSDLIIRVSEFAGQNLRSGHYDSIRNLVVLAGEGIL